MFSLAARAGELARLELAAEQLELVGRHAKSILEAVTLPPALPKIKVGATPLLHDYESTRKLYIVAAVKALRIETLEGFASITPAQVKSVTQINDTELLRLQRYLAEKGVYMKGTTAADL